MTRLAYLSELYAASGSLSQGPGGIDLLAIADPAGAFLDRAIRELGRETQRGGVELLEDLLSIARQLRWRALLEPVPAPRSAGRAEIQDKLAGLAARCRFLVGAETRWIVDELVRSAAVVNTDATPPLGEFLLQALSGPGGSGYVVLAAGRRAVEGIRSWVRESGVTVPVVNARERARGEIRDHAYLVGPPWVFGPTTYAAPVARHLTYLFPSWIQDRALPVAEFSKVATGGMGPRSQLRRIGEDAFIPDRLRDVEARLVPEPIWTATRPTLAAGEDEVDARRVFLSGGLSIMLDLDGESIRILDPSRPAGKRVRACEVDAVGPGTYLVLREGQTESGVLYARALSRLGAHAQQVEVTQSAWKAALRQQLRARGTAEVVQHLRALGVRAATQAPAWTVHTLARPKSDTDFKSLLAWLGLLPEPYFQHANLFRRARSHAVAEVREELEAALGDADVAGLEDAGFLRLDLEVAGFAGIIATRVLAISPHLEVVPRHELRIPVEDGSARWLE